MRAVLSILLVIAWAILVTLFVKLGISMIVEPVKAEVHKVRVLHAKPGSYPERRELRRCINRALKSLRPHSGSRNRYRTKVSSISIDASRYLDWHKKSDYLKDFGTNLNRYLQLKYKRYRNLYKHVVLPGIAPHVAGVGYQCSERSVFGHRMSISWLPDPYHVLRDCAVALHEVGHNLGASHRARGSNCIMAPGHPNEFWNIKRIWCPGTQEETRRCVG